MRSFRSRCSIVGCNDHRPHARQRCGRPTQCWHLVSRHRIPGQTAARGWPEHFFPRSSFSNSACMLISAYIFLRRRFLSCKALIWQIICALIPMYFARHLQNDALLIPCSRHSSETGNRLQLAAGLQEFGVRYILSSSSKPSHASCRENSISASP